jgi:hypothetical protein
VTEQVDARKHPIDGAGARAIVAAAQQVYVAKGKKVLHFDMKTASLEDVLSVAIGPTGNLRAPAFRKGKTLVVGFEESAYNEVLG